MTFSQKKFQKGRFFWHLLLCCLTIRAAAATSQLDVHCPRRGDVPLSAGLLAAVAQSSVWSRLWGIISSWNRLMQFALLCSFSSSFTRSTQHFPERQTNVWSNLLYAQNIYFIQRCFFFRTGVWKADVNTPPPSRNPVSHTPTWVTPQGPANRVCVFLKWNPEQTGTDAVKLVW